MTRARVFPSDCPAGPTGHEILEPLPRPNHRLDQYRVRFARARSVPAVDHEPFGAALMEELAVDRRATRVFLHPDGATVFDPGPLIDPITQHILADLDTAVRSGTSCQTIYGEDAAIEVFIEVVEPRVPLVIFGAGADAVPLVAIAHRLGWHTTVVDTQASARSLERFANADAVILCRPEEVSSRVLLTEATAVVLMTHNHLHDLEVLDVVLKKPVRYLGCLGPRLRAERLMSQLPCSLGMLETLTSGRLHAPVGIDIGAETPSEIALSIAAEILAVLRGRSGGPLHLRRGSIHGEALTDISENCVCARV